MHYRRVRVSHHVWHSRYFIHIHAHCGWVSDEYVNWFVWIIHTGLWIMCLCCLTHQTNTMRQGILLVVGQYLIFHCSVCFSEVCHACMIFWLTSTLGDKVMSKIRNNPTDLAPWKSWNTVHDWLWLAAGMHAGGKVLFFHLVVFQHCLVQLKLPSLLKSWHDFV